MKCIWCGHSEHAFKPGKPYCEGLHIEMPKGVCCMQETLSQFKGLCSK